MTDTIDISSLPVPSAGSSLKRALVSLIDRALHRIESPSGDCTEDVHFVRTTIKRLRAMLRLIQPAIRAAAFERENVSLKNAARRLAGLRDAAVGQKMLERLAKAARGKREPGACKVVLDRYRLLGPVQSVAQQKSTMRSVARRLRRSRQDIQRLQIVQDEWRTIGPGLAQVYRSGRKRMRNALTSGEDAAFHRWRVRVKNLYFQMQWLTPLWPKRLRRMMARLTKLQKALGADHDVTVLKAVLEKSPNDFGGPTAVKCILARLKKRSGKFRRASRPLGEKIFAQKPDRFIQRFKQHWRKKRGLEDKKGQAIGKCG